MNISRIIHSAFIRWTQCGFMREYTIERRFMKKPAKTTILFACAFAAVTLFNYYYLHGVKGGELKNIRQEKIAREKEFNELKQLADSYKELRTELAELMKAYYERDKVLPSLEDSRISFAYFNSLLRMPAENVNFSFITGGTEVKEGYYATSYAMAGDMQFLSFYDFLYKLEHFKRLYRIESLNVQEIIKTDNPEKMPVSFVKFNMAVKGFSAREKLTERDNIRDDVRTEPVGRNPFLAIIKEQLPPNTGNLPVAPTLRLQGMTDDRAFLTDANGDLLNMQVGDEVYLGYLAKIDKQNGIVEFTLNRGGLVETVILSIEKNE